MSNGSNPISLTPAKPVDPLTFRVIRAVHHASSGLGLRYFVAGAMARDLMLVNIFGLRPGRATGDIDFGIVVENWDQFQTLKSKLAATGEFRSARLEGQRMFYRQPEDEFETPVDIIPFGGVTSADYTIAWPPDRDMVMNVAGFSEAFDSAVQVEIGDGLSIRVASIPGLTVLKLLAWLDRRDNTDKDAADLHRLLGTYADAGNLDRLYGEELGVLEAVGFDLEAAGARLLGRDAACACRENTREQIRGILSSERLAGVLVSDMIRTSGSTEEHAGAVETLFSSFRQGFFDELPDG